MICNKCKTTLPENSKYCFVCGSVIEDPSYISNSFIDTVQKPTSKRKWIFISYGALLAIAVIIIFLVVCSSSKSPVKTVKEAFFNSAQENSFRLDISSQIGSSYGLAVVEMDCREDKAYFKLSAQSANITNDTYFVLDEDGLYSIESRADYDTTHSYNVIEQMSRVEARKFLDMLNSSSRSEQNLMKELEDTLSPLLGKYFNCDDLDGLLNDIVEELDRPENLKDILQCDVKQKEGNTIYSFHPDVYECLQIILEQVEDRIENSDDYYEIMDGIRETKSILRGVDIKISFGVKKRSLSYFSVELNSQTVLEGTFSDINETTIVLPDGAKEALEEYKQGYIQERND